MDCYFVRDELGTILMRGGSAIEAALALKAEAMACLFGLRLESCKFVTAGKSDSTHGLLGFTESACEANQWCGWC